MTKSVYFSHGEKGGVGKSQLGIALMESLVAEHGADAVLAIETDVKNSDFGRKAKHIPGMTVEVTDLRSAEGWSVLTDFADRATQEFIVVNLPSQISDDWGREIGVFASCFKNADIRVFWTINRHKDSIKLLEAARKACEADADAQSLVDSFIVVKNLYYGASDKFMRFDMSAIGKQLTAEGKVIVLPELNDFIMDKLDEQPVSYGVVASDPAIAAKHGFGMYDQVKIRRFLEEASVEFHKVL